MNQIFTCLLLLFCLTNPSFVSGQAGDPLPDEVTFTDGTTAQVTIKRSSPIPSDGTIAIRRAGDTDFKSYGPEDIANFRFGKSGRRYRAVEMTIPGTTLPDEISPSLRFGEVLASGEVELIKIPLKVAEYESHAADAQPYYYILRKPGMELLLALTTIYVYEQLHANPSRFRNRLKFFAEDCTEARKLASDARFYDSDILRVIDLYARCESLEERIEIDADRMRGGLKVAHYARLHSLDIRDANFGSPQFGVGLGYQAEARVDGRLRRFGVLVTVEYANQNFLLKDQARASQEMIRGNFSIGYSPLLTERSRLMVTGGLTNYNSFNSNLPSFFSNNYFLFSGGLRYSFDNYLISAHYEHLPYQNNRRPENMLVLGVGYRIRL